MSDLPEQAIGLDFQALALGPLDLALIEFTLTFYVGYARNGGRLMAPGASTIEAGAGHCEALQERIKSSRVVWSRQQSSLLDVRELSIDDAFTSRYLTRREAARRLAVSVETIDRARKDGRLPFTLIGRSVRIDPEDLATIGDAT